MSTKKDITGLRFGRWIVLEENKERFHGRVMYLCRCDCGTERIVEGARMRSGGSQSCGCLKSEAITAANKTHGLSRTPLYVLWLNVRKRCYDTKIRQYKDYGGRGIKMYEPWINDPVAFIKWCENNGWQKGLQLDRKNNEGHYVPDNLRFISHKQQQRNTRKNVFYTHNGETKCLSEWAEFIGIKYATIISRIIRGWTTHDAIFGKKDKKTWKSLNIQKAD